MASAHPTNGVWEDEGKKLRPLACRGSSAFGGQPSWIVTTKVAPDKKIIFSEIIIWGHRGNRFTDRVAKSLYRNDNIDFRAGACEGVGELVIMS